jgi:SAM-dependent methyltransferase
MAARDEHPARPAAAENAMQEGAAMTANVRPQVDWQSWLRRWDAQQAGYIPDREGRFAIMLDALGVLLPEPFVALDLACGPGSISQRLLARFPGARAIAVDIDPVLLALGRGALGTVDGRMRWVEADLASPTWLEALGETQVDAVLSTTALHWLTGAELLGVYRDLGRLVRPGGVFLNGDNMAFGPELPSFRRLAGHAREQLTSDDSFAARGIESWKEWWDALGAEPSLGSLIAERERRFARKRRQESPPIYDLHVAALRDAGFHEVGTIWQTMTNRVLLAVR